MIGESAFSKCTGLNEVIFAANANLRSILGFTKCKWLSRLEIPASVEMIGESAFSKCTGLNEVIFAANANLRSIPEKVPVGENDAPKNARFFEVV
jgi:hypothetical protein